ncbi:MAG: hypothetical protein JWL65_922 [Gammaproteobacteria bacterium]|nr:hypothetical protein [Gammaproteobacteria bacterium]
MIEEETVGPFSSWGDVKKTYGAAGDGVTDDTPAIQRGLNDLGQPGKPQVLYFPPGTYKLTATLTLTGVQWRGSGNFRWGGVSLIGDSPTTTRIKWFGPPGTAMLIQDGGFGTRYSRLTWDGSTTAQYGIAQWWNTSEGHVYGGGTEHQDEVFQDMAIGIMAGRLGKPYGQLDSEGQIRRVVFVRNRYAGVAVGSWNALDWWVWDSQFVDCGRGVTNNYNASDSGQTKGAGTVYVYRSLFQRSTVADMAIANTGWFSLHNNVSIGSRRFFEAAPLGANEAVVIAQNNRVVQSTDPVPISLGNTGPMFLVDNAIQAKGALFELTDWIKGRDVLSLGNKITGALPAGSNSDRIMAIDDTTVTAADISTQPLTLPPTPGWAHHSVFEVPPGANSAQIQALIDQATRSGDPLPIVHFAYGTWTLREPLRISSNRSVQLVGDGYGSILTVPDGSNPASMLQIAAPARVTIRDMQWVATRTTAVTISGADREAGRIQVVGSNLGPVTATHLDKTRLSLQANPAITSIALDAVRDAVAYSNGVVGLIKLSNDSDFLIADAWYEGPETALFRINDSTFTYLGGHMAPASHSGNANLADPVIRLDRFSGTASWLGMESDLKAIPSGPSIVIGNETSTTHAYFMGLTSNKSDYFSRSGGPVGKVGFILNRTSQASISVQATDAGATSAEDIRNAWKQARAVTWDSAAYQVPAGSVDVRIYRMKMDQTAGLDIRGR